MRYAYIRAYSEYRLPHKIRYDPRTRRDDGPADRFPRSQTLKDNPAPINRSPAERSDAGRPEQIQPGVPVPAGCFERNRLPAVVSLTGTLNGTCIY